MAYAACGDKLAGQPFVQQNKPGANGVVAANFMRQQPNDGYSLMVAGMSQTTITPFIFIEKNFTSTHRFISATSTLTERQ